MTARRLVAMCLAAGLFVLAGGSLAEDLIMNLRTVPLPDNPSPPRMHQEINTDIRQSRNYPEQPPVIPHKIEGYEVTRNFNKCMTCHARSATEVSQAPMVSITHFMDRDGQFLASISPRRYFCNQCHVSQTEARLAIENTFIDIDSLIAPGTQGQQ